LIDGLLGAAVFFLSSHPGVVFFVAGTPGFFIASSSLGLLFLSWTHRRRPLLRLAPTPATGFIEAALPRSSIAGFHQGGLASGSSVAIRCHMQSGSYVELDEVSTACMARFVFFVGSICFGQFQLNS
jgi:hypothetical protein